MAGDCNWFARHVKPRLQSHIPTVPVPGWLAWLAWLVKKCVLTVLTVLTVLASWGSQPCLLGGLLDSH